MRLIKIIIPSALAIIAPDYANAYIGPGLGAGTIGVILGVVGSLFIALFAIVWYPLKRLLKNSKNSKSRESDQATTQKEQEL